MLYIFKVHLLLTFPLLIWPTTLLSTKIPCVNSSPTIEKSEHNPQVISQVMFLSTVFSEDVYHVQLSVQTFFFSKTRGNVTKRCFCKHVWTDGYYCLRFSVFHAKFSVNPLLRLFVWLHFDASTVSLNRTKLVLFDSAVSESYKCTIWLR